ncbi:MAG: AMP-dependent synthetase/ligase [Ktedonobacterales bacterium]
MRPQTVAALPGETTNLAQLFRNCTAQFGDAVRWRQPQGQRWHAVTYRQNQCLVNRVMSGLDALGAHPGDAIGILSHTRWEWVVADWAITGLGGMMTPIYPSLTPKMTAFLLRDAGVRFLFLEDATQYEKLVGIREGLPQLTRLILLDDAQVSPDAVVISFAELMELGARSAEEADAFAAERAADIQPDDTAALIYTSGTTGAPKGVVLTHRTLLAQLAGAYTLLMTVTPGIVDLLFLPLSHVLGRLEQLLGFAIGSEMVIEPSLVNLTRDLPRVKPNVMVGVPLVYEKAYASLRRQVGTASTIQQTTFRWAEQVGHASVGLQQARRNLPVNLRLQLVLADVLIFRRVRAAFGGRLQFAFSGGAPLDPDIVESFHAAGMPLLEGWGLTETGGAFTFNQVDCFRIGTVGKPYPGHELRIGEDGEILIRGPCVFPRYHNNPLATAEAFDTEGWFHTGDIGALDADGFLTIRGRKKDLIDTAGGEKIAPQQVEALLNRIPLVAQSCVYGDRKPYLVALLTLEWPAVRAWASAKGLAYHDVHELASSPALRAELDGHLAQVNQQLAHFEQVRHYGILAKDFTVENKQLTPTSKIRRSEIVERYRAQFEALYQPTPAAAPSP